MKVSSFHAKYLEVGRMLKCCSNNPNLTTHRIIPKLAIILTAVLSLAPYVPVECEEPGAERAGDGVDANHPGQDGVSG